MAIELNMRHYRGGRGSFSADNSTAHNPKITCTRCTSRKNFYEQIIFILRGRLRRQRRMYRILQLKYRFTHSKMPDRITNQFENNNSEHELVSRRSFSGDVKIKSIDCRKPDRAKAFQEAINQCITVGLSYTEAHNLVHCILGKLAGFTVTNIPQPQDSTVEMDLCVTGLQVKHLLEDFTPTDVVLKSLVENYQEDVGLTVFDDFIDLLHLYRSHELSPDEFREKTSFLSDYIWEMLHTGKWVDVAPGLRVFYAATRLLCVLYLLHERVASITPTILKSMLYDIDYSLIMGLPILDGVASKIATTLHRLLNELEPCVQSYTRSEVAFDVSHSIDQLPYAHGNLPLERISRPSLEHFQQLMSKGNPFIITDAISFWPACQVSGERTWTISYWRRAVGHRLVPVEIGSRYTEEAWGQELITVNQFIDEFIVNRRPDQSVGYLAQHQLFIQCPELGEDVMTPDYCFIDGKEVCPESTVDSNIWFGPENTISPLHHDSDRANLLAQIGGTKYVILYPASQTPFLYPHEEPMLSNTSMVDVENPDLERYPNFANNAQGFHGLLKPREMLFIPPRCWHYVRSLSTSFSVNFWWNVSHALIPEWPTV